MARIICIDDDMDVLETCKYLLSEEGHTVETAITGKEGFEKSQTFKPDIILLDVMMEDVTAGFHTAYHFRQDNNLKHTPILMLTSINQKMKTKFHPDTDGEFLPVDEFIEKPIIRESLVKAVDKLLDLPKEKINLGGRKRIV